MATGDVSLLLTFFLHFLSALTPTSSAATDAPPSTWQYFCFESASHFATAATTTIFSLMPDPDGGSQQQQQQQQQQQAKPRRRAAAEDATSTASSLGPVKTVEQARAKLESLRGTCYFMRVGYWTYEVCPFLSVRQYHSETGVGAKSPTTQENSLGTYNTDKDELVVQRNVYTQAFEGGNEGRSALVRFLCPDSWRDEDGVVVVHEPKAKQYVITVRVQALCNGGSARGGSAKAKTATVASGSADDGDSVSAAPPASPPGAIMQIAEMILPNTKLLSSIRGRCFSMTVGYWTYEFCPQQHVRQFRKEGNRVGVEFSLGSYDRTADKVTVGVRGQLDRTFVPHSFAQHYGNGTANRRTTVRVRCNQKNEHALVSIEEPSTHEYVLLFTSPLGCELGCAYASIPASKPSPTNEEAEAS